MAKVAPAGCWVVTVEFVEAALVEAVLAEVMWVEAMVRVPAATVVVGGKALAMRVEAAAGVKAQGALERADEGVMVFLEALTVATVATVATDQEATVARAAWRSSSSSCCQPGWCLP